MYYNFPSIPKIFFLTGTILNFTFQASSRIFTHNTKRSKKFLINNYLNSLKNQKSFLKLQRHKNIDFPPLWESTFLCIHEEVCDAGLEILAPIAVAKKSLSQLLQSPFRNFFPCFLRKKYLFQHGILASMLKNFVNQVRT